MTFDRVARMLRAMTLKELLWELDKALVTTPGKSDTMREAMRRNWPDDAMAWWKQGEAYLSDGGYSRVCIDDHAIIDTPRGEQCEDAVFLTSNSRDEVKALWDTEPVRAIRAKLDAHLTEAFNTLK